MSGGNALRRGWRSPVATTVVALATVTALGALSGLLAGGPWPWRAAIAVALTALVVGGVRSLTRSAWLPSLVGLVVAAYALLAWYATPPGGNPLLVGPGTVERAGQLLAQAAQLIETSVVPLTVWPPVEAVLVGAAVLVFLAADLLAVGCGMPALTGLAYLAVWTPSVVLGFPGSTWALAGTGFAYLVLLALAQPSVARDRTGRRAGIVVVGAAGLVALTLAAGPVVAAVPAWSWLDLPDVGTGAVGPVRLADDLDLRDSLRQQSDQVVLRYTVEALGDDDRGPAATAGNVGPLRSFTLRDFDGRGWERDPTAELTEWDPDGLLASDPALVGTPPDDDRGTLAQVDVQVGALREQRLPVSTFPRTVEIDGAWSYDVARDEVVGRERTDVDTRYAMTVEIPDLTPEMLRSASGDRPGDLDPYLAVPGTDHEADLRALAAEVTEGATTPYDQALALQTYFRDSTRFRYDTTVDAASSDDAVWDFLESRRGYCVQFATAMTVLARTLDIPARLGVGFLPGDLGSDRVYRVTGADAHAWPELYFPGTGWVRFEPTPAVQTGPPPSWSNPFRAAAPTASPSAAPAQPSLAPTPGATTSTAPAGSGSTGGDDSGSGVGPVVLVGVVLGGLAATAGALALLRRRRGTGGALSSEVAWRRLRDRLRRAGITWSDARTPRQVVDTVRAQVESRRGRPLTPEGDRALVALATAVEQDRYAPHPVEHDATELQGWVAAVLTDVSTSTRTRPAEGGTPAPA